jgi:hypothetical protein
MLAMLLCMPRALEGRRQVAEMPPLLLLLLLSKRPPPPPGGVHLTCNCPSCHACRDVLPQRPVAGGVVQTHTTVLRGVQHAPNGMVGRNPATSAN